jgi:hypothetical protein
VARCAAACRALNETVSLDSTWRALALSMPAFLCFGSLAAHIELDPSMITGWRQVAMRLKDAPMLPTSLQLPDAGIDRHGCVEERVNDFRQHFVYYYGAIGGDRAVKTQEPWQVWYRRRPKQPPQNGFKVFCRYLRNGGIGRHGMGWNASIAAYLQRRAAEKARADALKAAVDALKAACSSESSRVAALAAASQRLAPPPLQLPATQDTSATASVGVAGGAEELSLSAGVAASGGSRGHGNQAGATLDHGGGSGGGGGSAVAGSRCGEDGKDEGKDEDAGEGDGKVVAVPDGGGHKTKLCFERWVERCDKRAGSSGSQSDDDSPSSLWSKLSLAEQAWYEQQAEVLQMQADEDMREWMLSAWTEPRLLQPVLYLKPNASPAQEHQAKTTRNSSEKCSSATQVVDVRCAESLGSETVGALAQEHMLHVGPLLAPSAQPPACAPCTREAGKETCVGGAEGGEGATRTDGHHPPPPVPIPINSRVKILSGELAGRNGQVVRIERRDGEALGFIKMDSLSRYRYLRQQDSGAAGQVRVPLADLRLLDREEEEQGQGREAERQVGQAGANAILASKQDMIRGQEHKLVLNVLPLRYFEMRVLSSVEEVEKACSPVLADDKKDDTGTHVGLANEAGSGHCHNPLGPGAGGASASAGSHAAHAPAPAPEAGANGAGAHGWSEGFEMGGLNLEWCLSMGISLQSMQTVGKQPGWDPSSGKSLHMPAS